MKEEKLYRLIEDAVAEIDLMEYSKEALEEALGEARHLVNILEREIDKQ